MFFVLKFAAKIGTAHTAANPELAVFSIFQNQHTANPSRGRAYGGRIAGKTAAGEKAGKHAIQNLISKAHEQGDGIVLTIAKDDFISEEDLYRAIFMKYQYPAYDRFRYFVNYNSQWKAFDRASFLKFYEKTKPR